MPARAGFDDAHRPQQPVALIFDQFERFFVNVRPALRTQFIQEIKACLDSDLNSAELNLVFALREDFFGALLIEFEALIPTFLNDAARVNLLPLRREEAREAILSPLKHTPVHIGYHLDFVDEVLLPGLIGESAGGERIDPPHLQIVCNQLYQAVHERCAAELAQGGVVQIDRTLYTELGETRGMLRTYLDEVLDRAAPREPGRRDVLRSMLKVMVESTGTRKFVALPDLRRGLPDVPAAQIEQHLQQLQLSRILETRVQDATVQYSLSHEVLVEKVQSWCDERELQRKKAQETLERGLAEWQSSGAVFNAQQVAHIRQWLAAEQLDAQAEELLNTSQQAYEEQQRKEAEQERRMRSVKRMLRGLLALIITLAVGLTTWALWERNAAQRQVEVARVHALTANANLYTSKGEREQGALLARQAYLLNKQYQAGLDDQITDALRTVLALSEGEAEVLAEQVCQQATRNLTPDEWQQAVGGDNLTYVHCQDLPGAPGVAEVLHLRSKPLTTENFQHLSLKVRVDQYVKTDTPNQFETHEDVVIDHTTGLTWQKSGSPDYMTFADAQKYVESLNQGEGFAGYTNWRLPTVEELLSLIEPEKQSNDLYINPVFDTTQSWVWSADIRPIKGESSAQSAWDVYFNHGYVSWGLLYTVSHVRCVRSGQ